MSQCGFPQISLQNLKSPVDQILQGKEKGTPYEVIIPIYIEFPMRIDIKADITGAFGADITHVCR